MIGTKDITNLKYYTFYILISHWQHHMWLFINLRFLSKLLKMGLLRSRIHSNFNSKGCDISRIQLNMDPSSQNGLPCIIPHHPANHITRVTVITYTNLPPSMVGLVSNHRVDGLFIPWKLHRRLKRCCSHMGWDQDFLILVAYDMQRVVSQ